MFKIAFTSALVAAASAQNLQNLASQATAAVPSNNQLQDLANQADAALAPILNEQNPVVQHGDNLSLDINNYEWMLTEFGNDFEFSVTELAFNNNNLEPNLASLLINSGEYLERNAETIANLLDTEAASLGIAVQGQDALALASQQYGAQLIENAESIAANVNSNYQNAAQDFASNKNGITTQANQQINEAINNEETLSAAVSNAIAQGLQSSGSLNNLGGAAINADGDIAGLVSSASNANLINSLNNGVGQLGALQSNAGALTNQGINAGSNAASNTNLPSGLINAAQSTVQGAAAGANSALNNNNLNAASINSLGGNQ